MSSLWPKWWYQFDVSTGVQDEVFWFEVSVDDSVWVQVAQGLRHTRWVEPGCVDVKGSSETVLVTYLVT